MNSFLQGNFKNLLMTGKAKLSFLVLVTLLVAMPFSNAAQLNPTKDINPTQSEQSMGTLQDNAVLSVGESDLDNSLKVIDKSKPSLWNWLTSASSKPAYFHYIDILELIS